MSEQLAELLPEHAAGAADDRQNGSGGDRGGGQKSRQRRGRRQREDGDGEEGVVEEDVEIFNIERGWIEDAVSAPGDSADVRSSLRGHSADAAGAAVSDSDGVVLDEWVLGEFAGMGQEGFDNDDLIATDGGEEMSWTTEGYDPAFWEDGQAAGQSGGESSGDEDGDLLEDLSDEEEDDDGWSVSAVPADYRVRPFVNQGSKAMRGAEVSPGMQRLLDSMPAKMQRQLAAGAEAADAENAATDPRALKKAEARRKTHRRLRIISGSAGGKRLLSPQGDVVRPMMEMVRAAVFSMIQSRSGNVAALPPDARWLDLFAGTGSIGLEALSRGCGGATFIELDPWVVRSCLQPNIAACGMAAAATVMNTKAESFLERSARTGGSGGYDFISVCPPYLLVSYPQLFGLLEASGLAKPASIILVEYPKRLAHEIPDTLCGLSKVRDRKYGRTFLALYAPNADGNEGGESEEYWQAY